MALRIMQAMDTATTSSQTPRALDLPFTGQALRQAVERRDLAALMQAACQLRVAGFQVDPQRLALDLLTHGCTWLTDGFGQRVPLQVHVPTPVPQHRVDSSVSFRISA